MYLGNTLVHVQLFFPLHDADLGASSQEGEATQETSHMTIDDQSKSKKEPANLRGGSLSLARIQSLVSMTTPRDGYQIGNVGNPAFVEFDLSIDGFASLFIPSVFPQSYQVRTMDPLPLWCNGRPFTIMM